MNIKAIIFDMDGTLTEHNAWLAFTKALGCSVEQHSKIYNDLLAGNAGLSESKQKLVALWQTSGNAHRSFIDTVFASWPLRSEAEEVIFTLQASGYRTCIITGSILQYAQLVAQKLEIEDVYTSAQLIFDDGDQLVDFDYSIHQAAIKLQQLREFCDKHNFTTADCIVVGDGDNDIDIFTATGQGVYLDTPYSSEKLKSVAWKTATDLSEIIGIIKSA